ncbi:MAG TPA: hypothetical protein VEM40_01415 [Nitrospirota bacterium]|nr:hypothetical protein [Nitrospirota bacterium]
MKRSVANILYHVSVVILSAGIALSLPNTIKYLAQKVLMYWSLLENEEIFLIVTEVAAAIILIFLVNVVVRDWRLRKLARLAKDAGLAGVAPATALITRRRLKKKKEEQGFGRNVMIINSTGFQTFTDSEGDLHQVLRNCREAKIMLLNPLMDGVTARAKSLSDPDTTPEIFREKIIRSIDFLKGLKVLQKNVRLKLYGNAPLLKLAILGDYLCLQHYPMGLNARNMPEYVFKHDQHGGLFNLFYQYFVSQWFDLKIPEYDLDTDELIYRDKAGNEVRREKFNEVVMES